MFPKFEGHLAGGDLFHVEQVVDQMTQAQAVAVGDFEHLLHGCRCAAERAADNQAKRAADGGQRGAQLMADRGHEVVLHLLDALALGEVHQRAADALRHALWITLDVAAQQHGYDVTVLVLQAQFGSEMIDVGQHGLRQPGFLLRQVFGNGQSLPQLEVAGQLIRTVTEHLPGAW